MKVCVYFALLPASLKFTHYCQTAAIFTVSSKIAFKERDRGNNFLWAPRLWIGRRWERLTLIKLTAKWFQATNGLRSTAIIFLRKVDRNRKLNLSSPLGIILIISHNNECQHNCHSVSKMLEEHRWHSVECLEAP